MRQMSINVFAVIAILFLVTGCALKVEEAKYDVVFQQDEYEVRKYQPYILAKVYVESNIEDAGSKAFRPLFKYITGENKAQTKIAMTSPVAQSASSEQIAMTAPVTQKNEGGKWVVSFMMPASYTMETTPEPLDEKVQLESVSEHYTATIRYSGTWSENGFKKNRDLIEKWVEKMGYVKLGEPVWARYNAPFSLWFLRRNEVMIPIDKPKSK